MDEKQKKIISNIAAVIILGVLILVGLQIYNDQSKTAPSTQPPTQPSTRVPVTTYSKESYSPESLKLTVQSAKYGYGYLEVHAIATNIGDGPIYSPTIILTIYDESGKVVLAQDRAWPAGTFLSYMQSGDSAAVDFIALVGGNIEHVRYRLTSDIQIFNVEYPQK